MRKQSGRASQRAGRSSLFVVLLTLEIAGSALGPPTLQSDEFFQLHKACAVRRLRRILLLSETGRITLDDAVELIFGCWALGRVFSSRPLPFWSVRQRALLAPI